MGYAKAELLSLMTTHGCFKKAKLGEVFLLSSGKTSQIYLDVRPTTLTAKGQYLLGHELFSYLDKFGNNSPNLVAGVVLGGCSLAMTVISCAYQFDKSSGYGDMGPHIDAIFVRPEPKDHGSQKVIEGFFKPGQTVILLEDVITSGQSAWKAVQILSEAGLKVKGVLAVVDRQEGGIKFLNDQGVEAISLFSLSDFK